MCQRTNLPSLIRFHKALQIASAMMLLVLVGCARSPADSEQENLESLQLAITHFYEAIENGDVEARVVLFSEDAIMMPNHGPIIKGEGAVIQTIRSGNGSIFRIKDRTIERLEMDGDLAYTANTYAYTYHEVGTEPQWHRTKNVHIWKRDTDGNWKIKVDIWNSDVSMADFQDE